MKCVSRVSNSILLHVYFELLFAGFPDWEINSFFSEELFPKQFRKKYKHGFAK